MSFNRMVIILLAAILLFGYLTMYGYVLWLCWDKGGPATTEILKNSGDKWMLIMHVSSKSFSRVDRLLRLSRNHLVIRWAVLCIG